MSTVTRMTVRAIGRQKLLATPLAIWLSSGPTNDQPHSQSLRYTLFPDEREALRLTIEQIVGKGYAHLPVLEILPKCFPVKI